MKKTKDYIVKLKPVLIAGNTPADAEIEERDLRWHVYSVAAHNKIEARGKALDCFHQEVPIGSLERVDIIDRTQIVRRYVPADPECMNNDRAKWAAEALQTFMAATGADLEDALCDLLCDLRHWTDRNQQSWHDQLARAMRHYVEETQPLDPNTDAIDRDLVEGRRA